MSIPAAFATLSGSWSGKNQLWLDPSAPPTESPTTLTAGTTAQGKFVTLAYTWSHEGTPHDGLLVVGQNPEGGAVQASWVDSFHNGDKFMILNGGVNDEGNITLKGSYSAGEYGEWGWQILLLPPSGDSFTLKMDNIAPDGTHYPAVAAVYSRKH